MRCPFCDISPPMSEYVSAREMDFDGVQTIVHGLLYSKCNSCGMETVTPQQSRVNKRTIIEAHKTALGLLTAAEIVSLRKQLGLTQIEAAQLFGGGVNAFSKYENSAITQSKAMDTLLRLARDIPVVAEYLAAREKINIKIIAKPHMHFSIAIQVGFGRGISEQFIQNELSGAGNYYENSAQLAEDQHKLIFIGEPSKNPLLANTIAHQVVDYSLSHSIN